MFLLFSEVLWPANMYVPLKSARRNRVSASSMAALNGRAAMAPVLALIAHSKWSPRRHGQLRRHRVLLRSLARRRTLVPLVLIPANAHK